PVLDEDRLVGVRQFRGGLSPHLAAVSDGPITHVGLPAPKVTVLFRPGLEHGEYLIVVLKYLESGAVSSEAIFFALPGIDEALQFARCAPLREPLGTVDEPCRHLSTHDPVDQTITGRIQLARADLRQ